MLTSAHTQWHGGRRECDLAIVGAGPAGLTLARELRSAGLDIVVLEAGGLEARHPREAGRQPAPTGTYDVDHARARGFGGTSNTFVPTGWRARPLDPSDFEVTDGDPWTGWPLSYADLLPFYRRAQEVCGLGTFEYRGEPWAAAAGRPSLWVEDDELQTSVFQLGPPKHFRRMADDVANWGSVDVVLGARVVEIRLAPDGTVEALRVRVRGGAETELHARAYVLACGGIDNARLLLASGDGGVGNHHDLVGRTFMEHLHADTGVFRPADPAVLRDMCYYLPQGAPGAGGFQGALSFRDDVRREAGLHNCIFWLYPVPEFWATEVGRSVGALRNALRERHWPEAGGTHLRRCLRNVPACASTVARRVARRPRPPAAARLAIEAEQRPAVESRVVLTAKCDSFGVPVPALDWRVTAADLTSLRATQERLDALLRRQGLGRIECMFGDEYPRAHLGGGHHHMGTTRMSADARYGVVDGDCRVHGVGNLFVAGSSVFPTSGAANPTLTIVALALRLADRLRVDLDGHRGGEVVEGRAAGATTHRARVSP